MDNMTDKQIEKLGTYIAEVLIEKSISANDNWKADDEMDHLVGELARCMTLQNVYEEREEYEKCAVMKIRVAEINNKLGIDLKEEGNGNET
jgi:hypothetical protein|tara:strand:- start:960 stop:1232 length:273 start_codon:yes stop_codon:yes gene_type:complete